MKLYLLNLLLLFLLLFNNLSANNQLDSLRWYCEIEDCNTVTRQPLHIIQSCAHCNKNEVRLSIHYATEALTFARKSHDLANQHYEKAWTILNDLQKKLENADPEVDQNLLYRLSEYEATIARQRHLILYHRIYLGAMFVLILILSATHILFIRNYRQKKKQSYHSPFQPKIPSVTELNPNESGDEKADLIYTTLFQYIVTDKHYLDNTIDIADVVRQCHINREEVNSILTLKTGMTLQEYVNNCRIEYAGVLLLNRTNKTIETIAIESGFNTTRTFLRQFKAKYKMSPSEYRHAGWAAEELTKV